MTKKPTNGFIFNLLEEWAPKDKAYDWDNVGLQIGSNGRLSTKIMVTLDVLESVVDEAIENNVDLIIAHHPLLFKALKRINTDTPEGRVISKLISHDITVYASHTNLDIASGGVNDMLANQLELKDQKPLVETGNEKLYKLAVHVPVSHQETLKRAIGDAGGGHQGDYTHCSFEINGTGSFKPSNEANPYLGKKGEITEVAEVKLEALVQASQLKQVTTAVLRAHPYEEPALDVIELTNKGERFGLGRIGKLQEETSFGEYIDVVKDKLKLKDVRVTGDIKKRIKRVAILGGSGEKYMHDAKRAGADAYITGDVGFHQAQIAMEMGLAVIDAGHYIEEIMKEHVQVYLQNKLKSYDTEVIISKIDTNPFQYR